MVSQEFKENFVGRILEDLEGVLNGKIFLRTLGSAEDQYKGLGEDVKNALIPFYSTKHEAQEFLFARIPVKDPNFEYMDFIAPVLNIGKSSIQGVGTFVVPITHPISETYVTRMWGFLKTNLFPHSLVVDQKIKPKKVIKEKMITSKAVNAINSDKELCSNMLTCSECKVQGDYKTYTIRFEKSEYPPGGFTVVPFHGHSIMIAKEAGYTWGAAVDVPRYDFKQRFAGFSGVAKHIAANPEKGQEVGKFYIDTALEIVLPPMLNYITNPTG